MPWKWRKFDLTDQTGQHGVPPLLYIVWLKRHNNLSWLLNQFPCSGLLLNFRAGDFGAGWAFTIFQSVFGRCFPCMTIWAMPPMFELAYGWYFKRRPVCVLFCIPIFGQVRVMMRETSVLCDPTSRTEWAIPSLSIINSYLPFMPFATAPPNAPVWGWKDIIGGKASISVRMPLFGLGWKFWSKGILLWYPFFSAIETSFIVHDLLYLLFPLMPIFTLPPYWSTVSGDLNL